MSSAPAVFMHGGERSAMGRKELVQGAWGLSQQLSRVAQNAVEETNHHGYCINLAVGRDNFTLGFCAALLAGRPSLLPANQQVGTIAELLNRYSGCVVLADSVLADDVNAELARRAVPLLELQSGCEPPVVAGVESGPATAQLDFPAAQTAAVVFTSGSTGEPAPIEKPWKTLAGTARLLQRRFFPGAERASIVATVPAQHMYGLETTVMMALCADVAVHSGRPFYPQDIAAALQSMPEPRVLVTTPIHLQALVRADIELPKLAGVISATAPLDEALAAAAEQLWACPVQEIYGCSEGGSLASRTTTQGPLWNTLDEIALVQNAGQTFVSAPHLASRVELQDKLELESASTFRLLGRGSDILNIGGKRASLAQINRVLLEIDGVQDGAVFTRDDSERLAALVVTSLDTRAVSRAMSQVVDPVFLPRPLHKVQSIPRNPLGKSTRSMLLEALRAAESKSHE